ncbi:MAG: tRNA pseudouridine(13) synthase TruD [Candidatus Bathyarchaeia archaeon]
MLVPGLERSIGIEVYATRSPGTGGTIRQSAEDFVVEEVLVDGSKAEVSRSDGNTEQTVLGSSSVKNRYLLCVLFKRNWDTFMALRNVAQQLGINTTRIQIAGIKDAKALTAQHVTIEDVAIEDVQKLRLKDIEVRPIGYLRTELSSYYLLGNSFQVRIKNVKHPKTVIERRTAKTVKELHGLGGIPNFFGHQRFGTTRSITHLVGKSFVKGNLKRAAMLFLAKSSPYEHPESRQARQELQATQDFKQAFKSYPKQLRYERMMLRSLAEKPLDFAGAFKKLPTKLLELFIQAYQSYLFNRFLSSRIKNGLMMNIAEAGDYVVNVEKSGVPLSKMYRTVSSETLAEINGAVRNGKVRLAIPLIGFRQHTSRGVQGEIESRILEEEGVSPHDFKVSEMQEMGSRGELRAIATPLLDFTLNDVSDAGDPQNRTIKVDFTLYRGSYATIVLREFMKPHDVVKAGF